MRNNKVNSMSNSVNKQNDFKPSERPSGTFHNGNNPSGTPQLKENRNTNVNQAGTAMLRGNQEGQNK